MGQRFSFRWTSFAATVGWCSEVISRINYSLKYSFFVYYHYREFGRFAEEEQSPYSWTSTRSGRSSSEYLQEQ